jgi:dethiobiotin synthetase
MHRIVVLGTGTDVGKTHITTRLVRALCAALPGQDVVGIKPVETGVRQRPKSGAPPSGTDAHALELVSRGTPLRPHPFAAFADPVSAHLAARRERRSVSIRAIVNGMTLHGATLRGWQVVETAGAVFSPLTSRATNLDLASALEPAIWILVAPDALGVLHDVRATLLAMRATAREPDYLVLSAARAADASVGTNGAELARVGLPKPVAIVARGAGDAALAPLVRALLRTSKSR